MAEYISVEEARTACRPKKFGVPQKFGVRSLGKVRSSEFGKVRSLLVRKAHPYNFLLFLPFDFCLLIWPSCRRVRGIKSIRLRYFSCCGAASSMPMISTLVSRRVFRRCWRNPVIIKGVRGSAWPILESSSFGPSRMRLVLPFLYCWRIAQAVIRASSTA